jgi:hypothetical protein
MARGGYYGGDASVSVGSGDFGQNEGKREDGAINTMVRSE